MDIELKVEILNLPNNIEHILREPDLNTQRGWLQATLGAFYSLMGIEVDKPEGR